MVFQREAVLTFVDAPDLSTPLALLKGFWIALFDGFVARTGNEALDNLLTRGGMSMVLPTIWLIISAMMFGAVMERTGMLKRIAGTILARAHSNGALVAATLATSVGSNIVASDQYIAIVLPGRMFRAEFKRRGLDPRNLSRCIEDAGTMTSALVPWNTCGAYMALTLGVPTLTYLPFCFLNLLSPIISLTYGFTGFTIRKLEQEPKLD
jgi:NhaC family Na+:H+ antiporter